MKTHLLASVVTRVSRAIAGGIQESRETFIERLRATAIYAAGALLMLAAQATQAHDGHETIAVAAASTAPPPHSTGNRWGADYFPNLPLVNQDGQTLLFYDDVLKDKIVAVDVIYTTCKDMCPLETANMVRVQKILGDRVGKEIFFYSISIDPANDTPEKLKAFAEKFHVGPGWQFLTGKPEDVKLIIRKLGLSRETDNENPDGHTPSLMVGDVPNGQWLRGSAVDNPQFMVSKIATFLGRWNELKPTRSYAEVTRSLDGTHGQYLFQSSCGACHSIGAGTRIGPDLAGVTTRREHSWLARYIQMPDKMQGEHDVIATELAQQFPKVRMPNLNLAPGDVAAVLTYLALPHAGTEKSTVNATTRPP